MKYIVVFIGTLTFLCPILLCADVFSEEPLFSVSIPSYFALMHKNQSIVSVAGTEGMVWRDDLHYLTNLVVDEDNQMHFRTYAFTTIDSPGFYKLAGNVSNQITISSDDVTLDLNGHTVSGGIVINGTLSNITIANGAVSGVTTEGILVNAGCTDIALKNMTVKNAMRGINFEQVINGLIRNCDLTLNTTGLELDRCRNIVIENCSAQANTNAGYSLLSSTTCSFFDCKALSTGDGNASSSGDSSFVFGFVSSAGTGNLFENCVANSTQNLSATDFNTVVAGIALKQSEQCSKIIGCEAGNSTTDPDGFAVPYGIWLEGTLDSTQSVTGLFSSGTVNAVSWSPDDKYIAVGGNGLTGGTGNALQTIEFDQENQLVLAIAGLFSTDLREIDWSPSGNYIAVVGSDAIFEIVTFDRIAQTLKSVADSSITAGTVLSSHWSFDEQYVAIAGFGIFGGTGDQFQIFRFDRVNEILTSIVGVLSGFGISIRWSPDGQYIAVGGVLLTGGTGDQFQVFQFNRTAGTLTSIAGALSGTVNAVSWSPDGEFIAIGGSGVTGGTGDEFQVFRFDRNAQTLTSIDGALGTAGAVSGVSWSPDGQYISVGGNGIDGDEFQIFRFDRTTQTLTNITGLFSGDIRFIDWSHDGHYVALGGSNLIGGSNDTFQIVEGIQFPSQNVIQNNMVYCNTSNTINGVGISGSSTLNMIIDNTTFDNPFNYQFVTNVFNQLFGDAPTALQNNSVKKDVPIADTIDFPVRLCRIELLAESLIDNLL